MNQISSKQAMRTAVKKRLAGLTAGQRSEYDAKLCAQAENLPELTNRLVVMGYMPLPDEINLKPFLRKLLSKNLKLALPRTDKEANTIVPHLVEEIDSGLVSGVYCIMEPSPDAPIIAVEKITAVLVPGRAFSPEGFRLGRGGGYYDRFLDDCPAIRIAFCYEEQIFSRVPVEAHDLPVDLLITPERILRNSEATE